MSAVVCGLSIIKYKLVSSANNLVVDCMSIAMSFKKIIKPTNILHFYDYNFP